MYNVFQKEKIDSTERNYNIIKEKEKKIAEKRKGNLIF